MKHHFSRKLPIDMFNKDEYLYRLVKLLVESYKPVKIYLFGSKAREDAKPESDYDLLVVIEGKVSWSQRKKFSEKRWDTGLVEPTDIVLWTKSSFEDHLQLKASLPSTVVEEGVLLYEAA